MGTGLPFGMEPPVVAGGYFEGQLVILEIIFAHIHMVAVGGDIVEGAAGYPFPACACRVLFDIAIRGQLLFDLGQIALGHSNIQGGGDRFQMFDFLPGFHQ